MTDTRPADIVSPISDSVLPNRVSAAEARAAGRYGHDKPTAENSILLLVDHQIGLMAGMRDTTSLAELKSNVVGLARTAKALGIPTLITSSNAQWQNGDNLPEIKELFSDQPIYRRTGIINCYEDPTFRKALEDLVEKTGRRHIIVAGVTIGTCCALPTLSMLNDGYAVFPVVDASGAWNRYEADAAMSRMANAGAELVSTFALACELQADWKSPTANAMLEPFVQNLSEYGFVLQNFWNNANGHTVSDPFGMVK
ncbi:isochorismatase family protein (plasmid) [Rhizobium sp. NIBRBAC000502774]|jgi:nicotinamidase-related amidase|uniref:isochorismatase family protein n=1 Tax=Agrobacterium TaxID=357 RepID=UPI00080F9FE3|nr:MULTISPECIES: isochorismatase family protein [Agrobacterium]QDG93843.1 isochorismatase family protein [Rhizobium sp. NIBRBAC000502774]NSY46447.1 isochorismatase family protein [Agrobacterium tumefaciens]NSZ87387.1 isochorismatase family protein [Agrobacterium tumefaciens]UZX45306.1 isochorismatase family protein [Agrobacterium sp. 13-2099-1-2]WCA72716.1 isochorismatase family protein [Agrobacterium tumefaciens]